MNQSIRNHHRGICFRVNEDEVCKVCDELIMPTCLCDLDEIYKYKITKQMIEEYIEHRKDCNPLSNRSLVTLDFLKDWLDQEGDPLASPDATWEELGRGFIEVEPDMSEGGE